VTGEAVAALDGIERGGLVFRAAVLPVAWPRAREAALAAIERARPLAVLSFGIHGDRKGGFRVETLAANELRFGIADNDGNRIEDAPVLAGGAASLEATLPADELLDALRTRGLEAKTSRDAGRFLCNAVYYTLLAHGARSAFVHVPPIEDGEDSSAVLAAVETCALVAARSVRALAPTPPPKI